MAHSIEVRHARTATEFWDWLSPEKTLFPRPCNLLYRGQADDRWDLAPGILRKGISSSASMQIVKEWAYINTFVEHCDSIGLVIPNDSASFREQYLNPMSPIETNWPPKELYPLLALAQHYGLPTRLLDWSTRAYVAAYFAVSDALARDAVAGAERLAVWILNIDDRAHFKELNVVAVPGGYNPNVTAQSGRFTFLQHRGVGRQLFEGEIAVDRYFLANSHAPPLKKVTLPIEEAPAALDLCRLYGISGATLFPDYYGAARATEDDLSRRPLEGSLSLWRR